LGDLVIRPAQVTWAAAVILFGSGIALALGIFAFSVPGADRTISIMAVVIGAWGIVTGTGLFGLRRWARISALIAGGLSAYVGFALTPMIPFFRIPVPPDLQEQITTGEATETAARIKTVLLVVFLLVGAVGLWWAYLFRSSKIKELFGSPATTGSRPFKFSVVGWYFVMNAILGILTLWQGVRHGPALMMAFGSLLVGWGALVVRALYTAVQLFLGVGLLRRTKQSRRFTVYYLLFECLNVIVFLLRPGREARIAAYHDMLSASRPSFDLYLSTASWSLYLRFASIEWAIFALITIWFLVRQNGAPDLAKS
jgi:hypothetical protein